MNNLYGVLLMSFGVMAVTLNFLFLILYGVPT